MIHVMLPVQYLRRAGERLVDPERRLMLAVLHAVVHDCRLAALPAASARTRRAYDEAMAYVESTDRSWPYSFENVCDAVGIDAGFLRRGISQVGRGQAA
jgi:hypothetical protein